MESKVISLSALAATLPRYYEFTEWAQYCAFVDFCEAAQIEHFFPEHNDACFTVGVRHAEGKVFASLSNIDTNYIKWYGERLEHYKQFFND